MAKYSNFITFIVILVFSIKTFALESTDNMKVQIIKVYDKNILVLNRGAEDGIFKSDHIKMSSIDGFIARGICLKHTMLTSHWKIYRVVRPELISKDTLYNMTSMNQSEIPKDYLKYVSVDFSPYFNDVTDKNVSKIIKMQQNRVIKFDLPTIPPSSPNFKEEEVNDTSKTSFISKNFNKRSLKNDMDDLYLNIYASPLSWQTRSESKEINFGFTLKNYGAKYDFSIAAQESQREYIDPVTKDGYKEKSSHYRADLQINRITENISLIMMYQFDREKIGETYYPRARNQLGLIGFKYHIWEKDAKSNFFNLSYMPVFDNLEFDDAKTGGTSERRGIRHQIKFTLHKELTEDITTQASLTYAPFYSTEQSELDYADSNSRLETMWAYQFSEKFFGDFLLDYSKDQLRADTYNIKSDNTTTTLRFRYEMSL